MKLKKKKKVDLIDVIAHFVMLIVCVTILYPMLNTVAKSFSGASAITAGKVSIFPVDFTTSAYKYVLEQEKILRSFGNSIYYTAVGVACNLFATALMAYPLSKMKLVGRSWIMRLVTFTMYFSGGTIPTFLLVYNMGLYNSMWSLIVPNLIWTMDMIICINGYQAIPSSLYEAAYLDGATEFQVFTKIALPLTKATLASIGLFFFMGHWNSFFLPLLYLRDPEKMPLQVVLRNILIEEEGMSGNNGDNIIGQYLTPDSIKNAIIVVTMVPVMIVYPAVQRYFVGGVMVGSVKG